MVGPPRLHEELGANGVEVTAWEEGGRRFNQEGSDLKTWPATTRSFRFNSGCKPEALAAFRSALPSEGKAAGVGQPFARSVLNLEFGIGNFKAYVM